MGKLGDGVQWFIDKSRGKTPRKELAARRAAQEQERLDSLPLMPDEDEILRNKRREVAGRTGGRTSTILSRRLGGGKRGGSSGGGGGGRTPGGRAGGSISRTGVKK